MGKAGLVILEDNKQRMNSRTEDLVQKILNLNVILAFLALLTLGISLQQYFLPERDFWDAMRPQYNNYLVFKYSFSHLVNGLDLYILYPDEYGDLFKYSPTFALFMGLFYYLPDWLGLILWNLLNMLCLYAGIRQLPQVKEKTKVFMLLYVLLELIGNLQNEQSNALMAGLILLTFTSFERKQPALAALYIMLGVYVKLFGLAAASLFLLYPKKPRFLLWMAAWGMVLWVLPLAVISLEMLAELYIRWSDVLVSDHQTRYGFSILGILHAWFGLDAPKLLVIFTGLLLFCLGYIRRDLFGNYPYRMLFLSSLLIWVILFNHTAESSGYVLAMTGCAIWYFMQPKDLLRSVLIITAFVVVSLFSTDLFPADFRNNVVYPYYLRTIPVIIIWCMILYQMVTGKIQPANKNIESKQKT